MGTVTLTNGMQAGPVAAAPTRVVYNTNSAIRAAAAPGGEARWLLYFARPFPLGASVTNAKLRVYSGVDAQTGTLTLTAKRIKTATTLSRVTWNTKPTTYYAGTAAVSRTGPTPLGTLWEIDVTAMMQSVALGDAWYGFELTSNFNPGMAFYAPATTAVGYRPALEVTWSDAPAKPRTLSPAGGRAVSVAKPIVRCDYVDVSGSTQMQSIQVQTNSTSTFTSPAFDSGTVTSSTPELDLSATALAGLTDGQTIYWRVRLQDGAGLWSDWSDPVNFTRDGKGTLTLTNPSSGTPIVEESTPPFSWTFTGETQAAYQLAITETKTTGEVKTWTTGKLTGTVTTVTPPAGVISSPDSTYQATIRVWDAKQRESTPGDPAYTEVVRDFTFVPSATVTATSSPTFTPAVLQPRGVVGWTRATDPDSFTVLRNRTVVASGLLPADVRVSGSTFAWTDTSAPPQTTLTYEVLAVVNGKASAGNPTVTGALTSKGIWLADTNRTNEVVIFDSDEQTSAYGETSEVVMPVGGTEVVLVTMALRGMEGTIKGTLQNTSGLAVSLTAQQWRDRLLLIKAKAGQKCWLTIGDRNIQCVIRNLSINRRKTSPISFGVSFDYYQTGTLEYVPTL